MIGSLRPYAAMKNSGAPWLGDVPTHWQLRQMKTLVRERIDKGHPEEPLLAATQTKGVVLKEQYENRTVVALKDLHLLKLVQVGDFVISLRSFQGGIEYARERGIISPAYTVLFPIASDTQTYLARLFKSAPFIDGLSLYVTGIRQGQNIDYEKLGRAALPLPPPSEQAAIGRFLDHADARINRYIHAKRRLIKLLEEQKQAIIHNAVTRGLDPQVSLRPSGVDWCGDVPAHWTTHRLADSTTGCFNGIWGDEPNGELDLVCIRVADFDRWGRRVNVTNPTTRAIPHSKRGRRLLHRGDLLIEKSGGGDNQPVGTVVLYDHDLPAVCSNFVARISPAPGYDPRFLVYAHESLYNVRLVTRSIKQTTGIQNLDSRSYLAEAFPFPPHDEQSAIADHLDDEATQIAAAINRARHEVDLLREYRTRLIADVVTGKLDVREASAALPDVTVAVEEIEDLDGEDESGDIGEAPEEVEA